MEDEIELTIGPVAEKYLDLRPQNTYDENIEALESVIEGEYEVVGETYEDLHPRVFHKAFSTSYHDEGSAKVDEEALRDMQQILEENSGEEHFWLEDKLFNLGYTLGPKNRRSVREKRKEREKPYLPHGRDMMPDIDSPMFDNPVREGRKKREGDEYYARVNQRLGLEIADLDIEVI